ncbi:MAG: plasminogen-binding N-terminal domain-containing protein [Sulfurovum sp.]|nr:plasminogen-binding N-terminal domain-containing protein [Sulfurovum sp.]
MRKIALMVLSALPLFAGFFPPTVHTSVAASNGTDIKLSKPFPVNGMSGIVIHHYSKDVDAITGYIAQVASDGSSRLVAKEIIHHDELPTIKTVVARGDKVIGGYLYDNVLLLAPDADTYAKITKATFKKWIHPDLFAIFLSTLGETYPTKANLARFAKQYQVGLIYIVKKNSAVLLDPISGQIVGKKAFTDAPAKAQAPFFMRFSKIQGGWFSDSAPGNYYQIMEQF